VFYAIREVHGAAGVEEAKDWVSRQGNEQRGTEEGKPHFNVFGIPENVEVSSA